MSANLKNEVKLMNFDLKNKKIVIWGTSIDAIRCIYLLKSQNIEIEYLVNTNHHIDSFMSYSVLEPSPSTLHGRFVIVATMSKTYFPIARQLREYQLTEFIDFIYWEWLFKKLVLLHGNCLTDILRNMLCSSAAFNRGFFVYPHMLIHLIKNIDCNLLNNIDIFIHQDIKDDNSIGYEVSDSYIRGFLKDTAIDITIPNLFGLSLLTHPQTRFGNPNNPSINNNQQPWGLFPTSDIVIDKCVANGMSTSEIISHCKSDDAMSPEFIIDNYNKYLDKIRVREKNWDIPMSDFIITNMKHKKLFYDSGHPTNVIIEYICIKVLHMLGIEENTVYSLSALDDYEDPVYPCVAKVLELNWYSNNGEYIRGSSKAIKIKDTMDIEEYIREYLLWCYGQES